LLPCGQVRQGLDRAAVVWLPAGAMTRRREHRVAVMAKPVLVVVDDEDASLRALTLELESRDGAHYRVVPGSSAEGGLAPRAALGRARWEELRAAGADVPLVLAGQLSSLSFDLAEPIPECLDGVPVQLPGPVGPAVQPVGQPVVQRVADRVGRAGPDAAVQVA